MNGNEQPKIIATMIIEVMGRPKEHLVETLEEISKKIDEEKGVKIVDKKINEPKLMENQENLFITFMEIEIEIEQALQLSILMFKYMPAHIEIIEPEKIVLSNNGFGDILNELTRRLHKYDELAKVMQTQNQALNNKLTKLEKK